MIGVRNERSVWYCFFCLFSANYLIQSARDGLTFFSGRDGPFLEGLTGLCSLLISALFYWRPPQVNEEVLVLSVLSTYCLCLVVFTLCLCFYPIPSPPVALLFFVISTMGNVFSSSFLWGLVVGRRCNLHYFSQAATLGQVCGSAMAWGILSFAQQDRCQVLLMACVLQILSIVALARTEPLAWIRPPQHLPFQIETLQTSTTTTPYWYLLLLALYQWLNSMSHTLVSLSKREHMRGTNEYSRSTFSSQLNLISAVAIVLVQASNVTVHLPARFVLLTVPLFVNGGLILDLPVFSLVLISRITSFALAKPVREGLFNKLSDADRIQTKPLIDGFVREFGQISAAWFFETFSPHLKWPVFGLLVSFSAVTWLITEQQPLRRRVKTE